ERMMTAVPNDPPDPRRLYVELLKRCLLGMIYATALSDINNPLRKTAGCAAHDGHEDYLGAVACRCSLSARRRRRTRVPGWCMSLGSYAKARRNAMRLSVRLLWRCTQAIVSRRQAQ